MKIIIFFLFLLGNFLILGNLEAQALTSVDSFLVGFSPFSLFNAEEGIPIFKRGESLWIYSKSLFIVSLVSPDNKVVVSNLRIYDSLVKLYQFGEKDKLGEWTLILTSTTRIGRFNLPLYLLDPKINVIDFTSGFSLNGDKINLYGTIQVENYQNLTRGEVFLVRKNIANSTKNLDTGIYLDNIKLWVKLSYDYKKGLIQISPYLEKEGPLEAYLWAEIVQDYPLIKRGSDNSYILSYKKVPVVRSDKEKFRLTTATNNTLALLIPKISPLSSLIGEISPFREGIAFLRVYIERGNKVEFFDKKIPLIKDLNGLEIVDSSELEPVKGKFVYSLIGDLKDSKGYEIVLVAKNLGLDSLWRRDIKTSIARIKLMNLLNGEYVNDFSINLPKVNYSKFFDTVYVPLKEEPLRLNYTISYRGINLEDLEPKILELRGDKEEVIKFKAGTLSISAKYTDGSKVELGLVKVFKDNKEKFSETLVNGNLNITLPFGYYKISLNVNGNEEIYNININSTFHRLEFFYDKPIIPQINYSRENPYPYLSIIIIEGLICLYVWKRSIRKIRDVRKT
ncbi:hypothetical protein HRbin06_00647 [archaeon HR06]|nr:hypothetical protein HRbin06_00647 [archaeon HR06]